LHGQYAFLCLSPLHHKLVKNLPINLRKIVQDYREKDYAIHSTELRFILTPELAGLMVCAIQIPFTADEINLVYQFGESGKAETCAELTVTTKRWKITERDHSIRTRLAKAEGTGKADDD